MHEAVKTHAADVIGHINSGSSYLYDTTLAGSVRDFVWNSGDNRKQLVVVGQLSWHAAYAQSWRATRPVAAEVPGTSPTSKPYPSRFPMPTSNR